MTMETMPANLLLRRAQRGVATVLTVLLVGFALTASVLGVMYYIRSTQEQLLTVHAQTQAQLRAWTGAQLVQKFLEGIKSDNKLIELAGKIGSGGLALTIVNDSSDDGRANLTGISMALTSVDNATAPKVFTAEITGTAAEGNAAESKSVLRVVYALSTEQPSPAPFPPPGRFKNLSSSGQNDFASDSGEMRTLVVTGDYDAGAGNQINGLLDIFATGSILIGSGSSFRTLHANCDVKITGGVTGENINAGRNACLDGGTHGARIAANNTIYSVGTYDETDTLAAGGAIPEFAANACKNADHKRDCPALSNTTPRLVVDLGNSAGAHTVLAKGDVRMRSGSGRIGRLLAEGNYYPDWGNIVDGGKIGGSAVAGQEGMLAYVHLTTESGLRVDMSTTSQVKTETIVISAYDYRSGANYDFHIKDGFKRVTVKNVHGIDDDEYYLVGGGDFLCPSTKLVSGSTSNDPKCTLQESALKTICLGNSEGMGCFGYDAGKHTWTVAGSTMAPGIAWFEGNISLPGNGAGQNFGLPGGSTYFNSFIATGNIDNAGSTKVYAPNYAGYNGSYDGTVYAPRGICSNNYFVDKHGIYPKQFCQDGKYVADIRLADYALISGSVPEGETYSEDTYVGGNITTGASSEVFGHVLAGNQLQTNGASIFHGFASAMGLSKITSSVFGALTRFLAVNFPPTFNRSGSGAGGSSGSEGGARGEGSSFKIKWATYL